MGNEEDRTTQQEPYHDYEHVLRLAKDLCQTYEADLCRLRNRVRELEDESYADKRLAEMESELAEARRACTRGFAIWDSEEDRIREWQVRHMRECHGVDPDDYEAHGATGWAWSFTFTPTSIGCIGKVRCHCGESMVFRELD